MHILETVWLGAAAAKVLTQACINKACSAKRVTISNPPVNLWDANVIEEFNTFMHSLNNQNETKVVVFDSDTADFWAAHIDLNLFQPDAIPGRNSSALFETYYENLDLLLTTPVIFIGEVNGRAWGAGDEHLLRMDMRFAGPHAQFGAPEAAVGLIHVGALQQLVRLIGPGRASEYMLAAAQVSGHEAARVGWVNSVHPSAEALRNHVDSVATRISLFPVETLRATKASIAEQAPSKSILDNDRARFNQLAAIPQVQQNVEDIIRLSKNQSRSWELNNNDNIVRYLY
ncbi:ClpP/crotonase-like domain-containing protein [Stachybotrys elegans]|uniref:ClpP/crotonase-like domain-containing protein n=1 Tax=Stachybotrys elegans TaxID=80388 RepID=A0A8K0WRU3_9HYPO|nr:ClpP/crotonase-like domain-containing protein [Stachybotrys elegans]